MSTIAAAPTAFVAPRTLIRWDRVAALLASLALGIWLLTGGLAQMSVADEVPQEPVSVVVQTGDTIYELAQVHAPAGTDTLTYASIIAEFNDVDARAIWPGMVLLLPQGR